MDTFLDRDVKDRPFKEAYVLNSTVITKFCHYLDYGDKTQKVIDKYSGTEAGISKAHTTIPRY